VQEEFQQLYCIRKVFIPVFDKRKYFGHGKIDLGETLFVQFFLQLFQVEFLEVNTLVAQSVDHFDVKFAFVPFREEVLYFVFEVFLAGFVNHVQKLDVILVDERLDDLQCFLLNLEVLALETLVEHTVDSVLEFSFTLTVVVHHKFVEQPQTLDGEVG